MKLGKTGLDLTDAKVLGSRTVLPTGVYNVRAVGMEMKENSTKTGSYLATEFEVLDGEHKGSVVSTMYNIVHNNPDAQSIGRNQLKSMLTAGQHPSPNLLKDTDEVIGLEMKIMVEEKPHQFTNDKGETIDTTQNQFKSYFKADGKESKQEAPKQETAAPAKSAEDLFANDTAQETTKAPWE